MTFQAGVQRKVINWTPEGRACCQVTCLATQRATTGPHQSCLCTPHKRRDGGSSLTSNHTSKGSPAGAAGGRPAADEGRVAHASLMDLWAPRQSHQASMLAHKGSWFERGTGSRVEVALAFGSKHLVRIAHTCCLYFFPSNLFINRRTTVFCFILPLKLCLFKLPRKAVLKY